MTTVIACCLMTVGARGAVTAPSTAAPVILVFGDSISAGYGIRVTQGWVNLLQRKLMQEGYGYRVVNASVSGETTAGGVARLPRALSVHHPAVVVLELGGNDGLRALPVTDMKANLTAMIAAARQQGARVLLVGMRMPPNYGLAYTEKFAAVYTSIAKERRVPFVPFLLDGIALKKEWMQNDGIHPNEAGQTQLLANVWRGLQPLLLRKKSAAAAAAAALKH